MTVDLAPAFTDAFQAAPAVGAATVRRILEAALPGIEKAVRDKIKAEDADWNEAIDWLLNSNHTGDPCIQAAFWMLAGGHCTRAQARAGFINDVPILDVYNKLPEHQN